MKSITSNEGEKYYKKTIYGKAVASTYVDELQKEHERDAEDMTGRTFIYLEMLVTVSPLKQMKKANHYNHRKNDSNN